MALDVQHQIDIEDDYSILAKYPSWKRSKTSFYRRRRKNKPEFLNAFNVPLHFQVTKKGSIILDKAGTNDEERDAILAKYK